MAGNPKIVFEDAKLGLHDVAVMLTQRESGYGLSPLLFEAIMAVESAGNIHASAQSKQDEGVTAEGPLQIKTNVLSALKATPYTARLLEQVAENHQEDSPAYSFGAGIIVLFDQMRTVNTYVSAEKYAALGFNEAQHGNNLYLALRGYKDGSLAIKNHEQSNADDGRYYPEKVAAYALFRASQETAGSLEQQQYIAISNHIGFDAMRSGHGAEFESKLAKAYQHYINNGDFRSYALNAEVPSLSEAKAIVENSLGVIEANLQANVSPSPVPNSVNVAQRSSPDNISAR